LSDTIPHLLCMSLTVMGSTTKVESRRNWYPSLQCIAEMCIEYQIQWVFCIYWTPYCGIQTQFSV